MMKKVSDFLLKYDMLPRGTAVIAAVSGGADSMCMLCVLNEMAGRGDINLTAAHFNHCLRGKESDRDERFVRDWCADNGIPFVSGRGDVAKYAAENGMGTEEAARTLRYAFLGEQAKILGSSRIATAHTADDNVETVLLNLTRGAGLKGLCGIPPVRGNIIRPMLTVTRREIDTYLNENNIPHVEDSTNAENDYSRNRIRHGAVPVLREINPSLSDAVASAAALLREDEEYLRCEADKLVAEHYRNGRLSASLIASAPKPIASRALRIILGGGMSSGHIGDVLSLAKSSDPGCSIDLPGIRVRREYDYLVFGESAESEFITVALPENGTVETAHYRITAQNTVFDGTINKSFTTFLLKYDSLCGNVSVTSRLPGDSITTSENGCRKTLQRLFIDKKIPVLRRQGIPVIRDDGGVLAVFGIGQDIRTFPSIGDKIKSVIIEEIKT